MFIYLLKSAACLAIFMAFYTLFLERENMHVFKRFYLLGALFIAFGIPLVTFTQYIDVAPLPVSQVAIQSAVYYPAEISSIKETNYLSIILWTIYGTGALLFGTKFLMNLLRISLKIKRNPKQKSKHIVHVLLSDLITPHTYFKYIFLNKQKFEQRLIPQEVFWHEETHAKQKHSIDVLFVEVLQVIFWFNPLIYFAKQSIKMNHEFLADQAVLNRGVSASNYQHILLAFSSDAAETPLANAINYSSTRHAIGMIKKRFTVMKTHTSKRTIGLKSVLLLPLLALTLYGFSEKREVVKTFSAQTKTSDTIQDILIYIDDSNVISLNGNPVRLEDLKAEIKKLNPHLTAAQKQIFVHADVQYEDDKSIALTKKIQPILFKSGVSSIGTSNVNTLKRLGLPIKTSKNKYVGKTLEEANAIYAEETIDLSPPKPINPNSPWQIGVEVGKIAYEETYEEPFVITAEFLAEYNTLAKSINSQSAATRTAKLKDFNRLTLIYSYMSADQKQLSEPFPKIGIMENVEIIQQESIYTILLNHVGQYLINDELVTLKRIENDFKAIGADKSQYKKVLFKYDKEAPKQVIAQVMDLIKKYNLENVSTVSDSNSVLQKLQTKATTKEIEAYNKLAKHINSQPPEKTVIRMKDVRLLKELQDKMTSEQRASAEPMPNFPPPPPPPPPTTDGPKNSTLINQTILPPPPPPPANASEKQQKAYENAIEEYKIQRESYTYKHTNDKGEVVDIIVIPENDGEIPPPPPPISVLDHIKEMSKKGAAFFYNDQPISSEEAIEYVKNKKNLSICTEQTNTNQLKVSISSNTQK